jgi:hypothetical protein
MEEPGKIIFLNPFKPLYLKIYIVIFSLVIVKLSRLKVFKKISFLNIFSNSWTIETKKQDGLIKAFLLQ